MNSWGTIAMLSRYIENVHAVSETKSLFSVGCTNCDQGAVRGRRGGGQAAPLLMKGLRLQLLY